MPVGFQRVYPHILYVANIGNKKYFRDTSYQHVVHNPIKEKERENYLINVSSI
jgi:hypothetical protein